MINSVLPPYSFIDLPSFAYLFNLYSITLSFFFLIYLDFLNPHMTFLPPPTTAAAIEFFINTPNLSNPWKMKHYVCFIYVGSHLGTAPVLELDAKIHPVGTGHFLPVGAWSLETVCWGPDGDQQF